MKLNLGDTIKIVFKNQELGKEILFYSGFIFDIKMC